MTSEDLLARAATRAAQTPFYTAWALQAYREQENFSPEELAAWLECAAGDLPRLGLCRRPDTNDLPAFAADVAHLAQRFGLNADALANLLRQSAFFETWATPTTEPLRLRAAESTAPYNVPFVDVPFLMAARDREIGGDAPEPATSDAATNTETPMEANNTSGAEEAGAEGNAPEAADSKTESGNG